METQYIDGWDGLVLKVLFTCNYSAVGINRASRSFQMSKQGNEYKGLTNGQRGGWMDEWQAQYQCIGKHLYNRALGFVHSY